MLHSVHCRTDKKLANRSYSVFDLASGNKLFTHYNKDRVNDGTAQNYLWLIPYESPNVYMGISSYDLPDLFKLHWELFKVTEKGFSEPWENKLTKALDSKNFCLTLWSQEIKRWDLKRRYIFGKILLPKSTPSLIRNIIPTVVRWDEKMEDITIAPLTAHEPKGMRIFGAWAVSPNGEWVRCGVKYKDGPDISYNCFFHLADSFPLGVSSPVVTMIKSELEGIFVESPTLGTLYIDRPPSGTPEYANGSVYVYKMSEFFESLKAQAAEKLK